MPHLKNGTHTEDIREYLNIRNAAENYIMRNFIIFSLCRVFLER
jgi:hypothetical protein